MLGPRLPIHIGAPTPLDTPDWVGRDAALIQYNEWTRPKQKNPPTDFDGLCDEDSARKKVKSDGQSTAEFMGNHSTGLSSEWPCLDVPDESFLQNMADKALQSGHCSEAVKLDRSRTEHVAKIVGGIANLVKPHIRWRYLENSLSNEMCSELKKSVFSGIANFILSIFDAEDFTKDHVSYHREANFFELARKLTAHYKADTCGEQQKQKLKDEKEAMKYIAEEINFDFKGLNEIDVLFLVNHCFKEHYDDKVVQYGLSPRFMSFGESEVALKQMERYVPLKRNCKMQLILELERRKGYHILDYLFVEVCQGFVSRDEFVEALNKKGVVPTLMTELVRDVRRVIGRLAGLKMSMLYSSRVRVRYPLCQGPFGKFDDEVLEVVDMADYERRIQGHPFIGVYHILFGLTFSRVGQHNLVQQGFTNSFTEKRPKTPPYHIYKLAGEYAESCGHPIVKLEHLALAVTDVQQGRTTIEMIDVDILDGLANCRYDFPDCSLKEVGLSQNSKPIEGVHNLVLALRAGLNIPEIRERQQGHGTSR